jgi:hypothetical protein
VHLNHWHLEKALAHTKLAAAALKAAGSRLTALHRQMLLTQDGLCAGLPASAPGLASPSEVQLHLANYNVAQALRSVRCVMEGGHPLAVVALLEQARKFLERDDRGLAADRLRRAKEAIRRQLEGIP